MVQVASEAHHDVWQLDEATEASEIGFDYHQQLLRAMLDMQGVAKRGEILFWRKW